MLAFVPQHSWRFSFFPRAREGKNNKTNCSQRKVNGMKDFGGRYSWKFAISNENRWIPINLLIYIHIYLEPRRHRFWKIWPITWKGNPQKKRSVGSYVLYMPQMLQVFSMCFFAQIAHRSSVSAIPIVEVPTASGPPVELRPWVFNRETLGIPPRKDLMV